jgi:hypothetical protein
MFLILLLLGCPVLDTATVTGALGEVTQNACVFTNAQYQLNVELTKLKAPEEFSHFASTACQGASGTTPVKAIGNEAMVCEFADGEKLVSRVRNQGFTVTLNGQGELRKKVLLFAEQVAGNLF